MLFVSLFPLGQAYAMHPDEPSGRTPPLPGLYITVYDPSLGGANCDWGECEHTALTNITNGMYGHVAACPSAWLGHITTTVVTIDGIEWFCVDAFGKPKDRVMIWLDGSPFYRIDLMYRPAAKHGWNQERFPREMWSREWRPMSEFYALREVWDAEAAGN